MLLPSPPIRYLAFRPPRSTHPVVFRSVMLAFICGIGKYDNITKFVTTGS